jgi:hypothetical protein
VEADRQLEPQVFKFLTRWSENLTVWRTWRWYWMLHVSFSNVVVVDPRSIERRHHLFEERL